MLWFVAIIVLLAALLGGAVVIAWFSMHPPRYRIRRTPAAFGATFEVVTFSSSDGTRLTGWWVRAQNPCAALILCHGMSAHRAQMLPWAEWLWKAGFSLLLFDFRALGESEGDLSTMGLHEASDVLAAVDYVKTRPDARDLPLGALGFSMGGVAILLAASREPRIEAVSTLGSYSDLNRAIAQRCRRHFGLLGPVVEKPARSLGARWFPGDPNEVDCVAAVPLLAPRACLFANGMRDPIVPPNNAKDLYAAACEPKDLLLLPHTAHDYPHPKDRCVYAQQVEEFFTRALVRRPNDPPGPSGV